MATLKEDIPASAEWISTALISSGYNADFSMESLKEIERFFNEHSQEGEPVPGGLLSESLGSRMFALSSYVGEVIRRSIGGEWITDDSDPNGEINITLQLPSGGLIWPGQKVMKRLKNGPEDSIAAYGAVLTR